MKQTRYVAMALLSLFSFVLLPLAANAQNQIPNPGFEIEGDGGETSAENWQTRAYASRSSEEAHSGDWSYEIDNTVANDFGQWKELRPLIPNPDDPTATTSDYPVEPGELYVQSMWVKVTEEVVPGTGLFLLTRPNGQNDAAVRQQTRFALDELELDEWTLLEQEFEMPEEDVNGDEVLFANPIFFIDTAGDPDALDGLFYYDDAYWGPFFEGLLGDFDESGVLDIPDINAIVSEVASGGTDAVFDLSGDGSVDYDDVTVWIKDLKGTWIGDADLNGEFNSTDLVGVFSEGLFETGQAATWSQGDWDADGVFGTADFVAAFTDGGYEQGPLAATAAVPEPNAIGLIIIGLGVMACGARRRS